MFSSSRCSSLRALLVAGLLAGVCANGLAQGFRPDIARLGAGDGNLSPWSLLSTPVNLDSAVLNARYANVSTSDYALASADMAVSFANRFEFVLSNRDLRGTLASFSPLRLQQNVVGLKLKMLSDQRLEQSPWLPQISAGLMLRRDSGAGNTFGLLSTKPYELRDARSIDFSLSASKSFGQRLFLNSTLRAGRTSQFDTPGLGAYLNDRYQTSFDASAAFLVKRSLVVGAEYRSKPNALGVDNEKAYQDIFVSYFPTKNLSLTLAYASLGDIAVFSPKRQHGAYMSLQLGF